METRIEQLLAEIKDFPKVYPAYSYDGEGGVNPAYTPLESKTSMSCIPLNQKMIWCLRGDLILALGVKNAYQEHGHFSKEYYHPKSQPFLKLENNGLVNRTGHPTLAMPEGSYDGSVIYAGWVCQREGYLQVYLSSGRFDNTELSEEEVSILQHYVALKFMGALGLQVVHFQEQTGGFTELIDFINDLPIADHGIHYHPETVLKSSQIALDKAKVASASFSECTNINPSSPTLNLDLHFEGQEDKGAKRSLSSKADPKISATTPPVYQECTTSEETMKSTLPVYQKCTTSEETMKSTLPVYQKCTTPIKTDKLLPPKPPEKSCLQKLFCCCSCFFNKKTSDKSTSALPAPPPRQIM